MQTGKQTITESTLTRMWREQDGNWLELHSQFTRIAKVLIDQACNDDAVRLFLEAAEHALDRMAYDLQYKAAA